MLDEGSLGGLLEGGDGAWSVGEGGLEMGEDLGGGLALGFADRLGRCVRWRAASMQGRANVGLCPVEAFPDALPGAIAEPAADGVSGGEQAAGDSELEEAPQGAGAETEAADLVGEPDAEGPSASGTGIAVAAKDALGVAGLLRACLIEAAQIAMPDQRADGLAVRAAGLLEAFGDRGPFLGAAKALVDHGPCLRKIMILPA